MHIEVTVIDTVEITYRIDNTEDRDEAKRIALIGYLTETDEIESTLIRREIKRVSYPFEDD